MRIRKVLATTIFSLCLGIGMVINLPTQEVSAVCEKSQDGNYYETYFDQNSKTQQRRKCSPEQVKKENATKKEEEASQRKDAGLNKFDNQLGMKNSVLENAKQTYQRNPTQANKEALDKAQKEYNEAQNNLKTAEEHYADKSGKTFYTDVKMQGGNAFGGIVESLMSIKINLGNKTLDFGNLKNSFDNFVTIESLKTWTLGDINVWETIFHNGVYVAFKSIGTSLCVLFLLVALLKDALTFDHIDWRKIVADTIKTVLIIMIVNNSWEILTMVGEIAEGITNSALNLINVNTGTTVELPTLMYNVMVFAHCNSLGRDILFVGDIMGIVFEAIVFILVIFVAFQYYTTLAEVIVLVFQRLLKLLFALSISPLPFSLSLSEGSNSQGVLRYCMYVAGIYLEGLIMLIAVKLYSVFWSTALNSIAGNTTGLDSFATLGSVLGVLIVGVILFNGLLKGIIEAGQNVIQQFAR